MIRENSKDYSEGGMSMKSFMLLAKTSICAGVGIVYIVRATGYAYEMLFESK